MSDINFLYNNIKQELEKPKPSHKIILSYLLTVAAENFNFDFYTLVANVFQLDPMFFMTSLYSLFRKKLGKLYGDQKIKEMEKYILEKFCLHEGEEILFECDASIRELLPKSYKIEVLDGTTYVTTHRIIAQGRLRTARMASDWTTWDLLPPLGIHPPTDIKPKNAKERLINASVGQELPCYGYAFPIKKLFNLNYYTRDITYEIIHNYRHFKYKFSFSPFKKQNSIDQLLNVLQSNKRAMFYHKSFRFKRPFKGEIKILGLNNAKNLVKALGGKINDTNAKTLSYLITNRPESPYLKFKEGGTKILTEQEFLDLMEG